MNNESKSNEKIDAAVKHLITVIDRYNTIMAIRDAYDMDDVEQSENEYLRLMDCLSTNQRIREFLNSGLSLTEFMTRD